MIPRLEEDAFRCKTLEKRRYFEFPSDGFSRRKFISIRYVFHGAGARLTWNTFSDSRPGIQHVTGG